MKKNWKKLTAFLGVAVIVLSASGCGGGAGADKPGPSGTDGKQEETAAGGKIPVKISMTESTESLDYQRCLQFTEKVNEACGDAFEFEIYANGSLGDFTDVNAECMEGTVEMIYGGLSPVIHPLAAVTIIPYLCVSAEDALTAFREEGFAYRTTVQLCEEEKLTFLGFDLSGMCGLALKGKTPSNPIGLGGGDKLQIRATSDMRLRAFLTDLGYIPTSVSWSEVYSSVQTGVIDGFVGATALTASTQFSDVIDAYYEIGLFASVNSIVVSNVFWDKLTDEQQAAFQKYGGGMLEQSVQEYQNATEEAYKKLKAAGVTVVVPEDAQLQELAELCRSHWDTLADDYGDAFYQEIVEAYQLK
ncbi:TRAP transporter substrate-binding protein DctP [Cuneatibacter sp. NSJ-177]|uniref:TRAP transporter substrate-binding protein n=1 Tax=Cuneatibacter sp. NSJ-177 TaxID=2931401 RepID=UPI001FD57B0D|nr:TRAP transporter substrate-binding protein DctP [Cuneatibacter sp. NSJ-177]MCJ7834433.1 TRAP transporter substrate-binding protein DctP [Cuneatibacter sp. NSJ-177]